MSNLSIRHLIDAFYQVLGHWAMQFQSRIFFLKLANQKQELPVAAIFVSESRRNEQSLKSTFHRCSMQNSVHLAMRFRGENFLEINQSETRIACSGHVSYRIGTKGAFFIYDLP
jgi:hypothetical protein